VSAARQAVTSLDRTWEAYHALDSIALPTLVATSTTIIDPQGIERLIAAHYRREARRDAGHIPFIDSPRSRAHRAAFLEDWTADVLSAAVEAVVRRSNSRHNGAGWRPGPQFDRARIRILSGPYPCKLPDTDPDPPLPPPGCLKPLPSTKFTKAADDSATTTR
jgi:hypothetical protein